MISAFPRFGFETDFMSRITPATITRLNVTATRQAGNITSQLNVRKYQIYHIVYVSA